MRFCMASIRHTNIAHGGTNQVVHTSATLLSCSPAATAMSTLAPSYWRPPVNHSLIRRPVQKKNVTNGCQVKPVGGVVLNASGPPSWHGFSHHFGHAPPFCRHVRATLGGPGWRIVRFWSMSRHSYATRSVGYGCCPLFYWSGCC